MRCQTQLSNAALRANAHNPGSAQRHTLPGLMNRSIYVAQKLAAPKEGESLGWERASSKHQRSLGEARADWREGGEQMKCRRLDRKQIILKPLPENDLRSTLLPEE